MRRKISILLAESVPDLAKLLASYLVKEGFDVNIASDGDIAKKKLLSDEFDILITDVMMPKFDGLQLLSWLNKRSTAISIVVTSGINFEQLPLFNEDNVIMKLAKPYSKECLLALVNKLNNAKKQLNNDI
jgi:DNA-binding response OmpR family regulator